ncbi:MAG: hypothetical protein AAGA65_19865 [Actinomycetota bacterium]
MTATATHTGLQRPIHIAEATRSAKPAPWTHKPHKWYIADWGPWGAAESLLKVFAILVALLTAFPDGAFAVPESNTTSFWILLGLGAAYLLSIADRLMDREITAMAFLAANLAGHGAIIYAMGAAEWPGLQVKAFAGLMLAGDLVKLAYFVTTGATVRNLPRAVPIMLTSLFAALYTVALVGA